MSAHHSIFPTFFLSGFECSTFLWKDHGRRDLVAETQHREHAQQDYEFLASAGVGVAREGVPWPLVDQGGGHYDFTPVQPLVDALRRSKVLPAWDLCHYGYPDGCDPWHPDFVPRFAAYCAAAAAHLGKLGPQPHIFTPINEITFWGFAGGEWGWMGPFGRSRDERMRLRQRLCEAAVAGVHAIRKELPHARMLHVEPLINVVAPHHRPDLQDEAAHEMEDDAYYAWDVLAGLRCPEMGGSANVLDIVGANCYSFGQMEFRCSGPHAALSPDDDRIVPLCDLMQKVWTRYKRPMVIAETSGLGPGREAWLRDVMQEVLAAVDQGTDLHGVCLFPAVDMPDWHTGQWLHNGLCDIVVEPDGRLRREPFAPYVEELHRWQRRLKRVTRLDDDPMSDPVDLQDVVQAARRWELQPDRDWA